MPAPRHDNEFVSIFYRSNNDVMEWEGSFGFVVNRTEQYGDVPPSLQGSKETIYNEG